MKANAKSDPAYCGPRVYTFTGGIPAYLSLDASQTTLTLSTNDVSKVGSHSVEFTVKLANFPGVTGITKTFQVTIMCETFTIAFTTTPANIFIELGITNQP